MEPSESTNEYCPWDKRIFIEIVLITFWQIFSQLTLTVSPSLVSVWDFTSPVAGSSTPYLKLNPGSKSPPGGPNAIGGGSW